MYILILHYLKRNGQYQKKMLMNPGVILAIRRYFEICKKNERLPWEGYVYYATLVLGFCIVIPALLL